MAIRFESLTGRERLVLAHVLEGRLNKQIAYDLGINERTVKVHRRSIMTKLDVRSVAALTLLALEAGIPMGPVATTAPGASRCGSKASSCIEPVGTRSSECRSVVPLCADSA